MPDHLTSNSQIYLAMIHRWRIWWRFRRAFEGGMKGLLFGLALALGFSIILIVSGLGVRYGIGLSAILLFLTVSGSGCAILAAAIVGLWPQPLINIALFYDRYFDLQERASTALEVQQKAQGVIKTNIAQQLLADTIEKGNRIKPNTAFFFPLHRTQALLVSCLFVTTLVVAFVGRPYFQKVKAQEMIEQSISAEITRLEELQAAIESDPTIPESDKTSITQAIEDTVQKLEQAETIEQAVAILSSAESELKALEPQDIQDQAQTLKQLGSQIQQSEAGNEGNNLLEEFGQALSDVNPIAAAEALNNLDLDSRTPEELKELGEQLKKSAEAVEGTNPSLARQFERAAEALENGEMQAAKQALQDASQELAQTGSQIAQANAIQEATNQTAQSAERLLETGRNAQELQAGSFSQAESSNEGLSQNNGQGSSSNQANDGTQGKAGGSTNQDGNQGSASGSGKGSTDQAGSSGNEAGENPINQNNGPGDGGERPFVPLNEGQRLSDGSGLDVYLPDSLVPGADVTGQANNSLGKENESTVPYIEVFPEYENAYRQAIETGNIPTTLRNLIRDYFSNLEP